VSEQSRLPTAADADDDPSIPLLTDRIFLPAVDLDTALPASLIPGSPAEQPTEPATAVVVEESPAHGEAVAAVEAASQDVGSAEEAAIEAELDRDLVAASDADFEALLSAEQQLAAAEVISAEATPAEPPAEVDIDAGTRDSSAAAAPVAGDAAVESQAESLRAAVLQRVSARLPEQVNAALRDLMQPAIDQALAKLGEEAEVALRIALQELVEQALREELAQRTDRPRS
jgi:hypothetical protein